MHRIVVVDDDLHVRQTISVWLKEHGFRVSFADGGHGGLAALDNAIFDLMIVDVFMPHMRGFEAIRLCHERAPTVPLIAISGDTFSDTESAGSEFLRLAPRAVCANRSSPTTCLARSMNACRRRSRIKGRLPRWARRRTRCPSCMRNRPHLILRRPRLVIPRRFGERLS